MDTAAVVLLFQLVGLILASAIIGSWFALMLIGTKIGWLRGIALVTTVVFAATATSLIPHTYLGIDAFVEYILTYGAYLLSMVVTAVIDARRKREAEWAAITKTQEFWKELLDEDGFLLHDIKPRS